MSIGILFREKKKGVIANSVSVRGLVESCRPAMGSMLSGEMNFFFSFFLFI